MGTLHAQFSSGGNNYTLSPIALGANNASADQTLFVQAYYNTDYAIKVFSQKTAIFAESYFTNAIHGKGGYGRAGFFEGTVRIEDDGNLEVKSHLLGLRSSGGGFFGIHANSSSKNGASLEFYSDTHSSRPGELALIATGAELANGGIIKFLRHHQTNNQWHESMRIDRVGNVGVGTTNLSETGYRLFVKDGIKTGRVKTDASLADYVFADDYEYPNLPEVEAFVQQHRHLPGVISQAEVDEAGGVELTAFTVQLQEKLEELYLHTIALEKRVKALEAELTKATTQE